MFQRLHYGFEILEGHIVHISHQKPEGDWEFWNIYLENVFWGGKITFEMEVEAEAADRILWMYDLTEEEFCRTGEFRAKGPSKGVICIYTNREKNQIHFLMLTNREQMYRRFLHWKHKRERVSLQGGQFRLRLRACVYSDKWQDFTLREARLWIDRNHSFVVPLELKKEAAGWRRISVWVPLSSIVSMETEINNPIHIEITFDNNIKLKFNIGHKHKRKKETKFYYVPIVYRYYRDFALFVRGNVNENYTLVVRKKEPEERKLSFRWKESRLISLVLYHLGRQVRKRSRRKVNLYFEKNSQKAEEGTFEVFEKARQKGSCRNYFILGRQAPEWETLSRKGGVVEKYSWFYYWLLYRADHLISTETSSHLNVHRAVNPYVRRALLEKPLIFLQHGVTYLKCQGEGSVFGAGKEGEPAYMAVCGRKEAEAVSRMLRIPAERCIQTGLPIFSKLDYGHIREASADIVTLMFTWRPWEEHLLSHFEDSVYYRTVQEVYGLLANFLSPEQIVIVPHPKVWNLLLATGLKDKIWKGKVSKALEQTKLLVTDYSSACYNVFYQGAGVVFYQPDLEEYEKEVGKLIPAKEEYIGHRIGTVSELEELFSEGIRKGALRLAFFRKPEHVENYREINEFSDGKNVERIVEFLTKEGII